MERLPPLPDLSGLSDEQKDALIHALWAQVQVLTARVVELEAKLNEPPKTPGNSSVPPSKGQKANRPDKAKREGRRQGSLGRKGGGRSLASDPDQLVMAKAVACRHCGAALGEDDHVLHGHYDKIDLPPVRPVVTQVKRYAGQCRCCGETTLAAVPEGMEEGSPFSPSILAAALYLRFTHAISYKRLSRLFANLYALTISEGALDAMFRRAKPYFDNQTAAILARLRRSRVVCSDGTSVRIGGKTCWNWVFQNDAVVIHVIRKSRATAVGTEVMDGHRPAIWVSDLYGPQQGHADAWQICLAHQLRDCQFAIEAGDSVFAPRMKALLLRAVVIARRRHGLAESTRRQIATASTTTSTPSWRSHPASATASACENARAKSAATSSFSSSTPKSRPTTMAPNANSGPSRPIARSPAASDPTGVPISLPRSDPSSEPPADKASMPMTQSSAHYAEMLSSHRVEQLRHPFIDKLGILTCADMPIVIDPARKDIVVHRATSAFQPRQQAGPSAGKQFELNRPTDFQLNHDCSRSDLFGHLKVNRAIATRYDQLASSFLGIVHIATARYWLKFSHAA